jgi:hypothetical protein
MPARKVPVEVVTPLTTVAGDIETSVTALAVVKFLLSTLIPVTKVPVEVETEPTTLLVLVVMPDITVAVDVETPVTAVAVDVETQWLCPPYATTLPAVAVEKVTGWPGLIAPSATTCATPTTSTLTLAPAGAESIATPTTFGYEEDAG